VSAAVGGGYQPAVLQVSGLRKSFGPVEALRGADLDLKAGEVLAVFPEGTTSNGVDLLPFHANLLQAAITADVPVQPVAMSFVDSRGALSLAPCYIDDDSLLTTAWRTARSKGLTVRVVFGSPQKAGGRDRRAWAEDLREEVIRLRAL